MVRALDFYPGGPGSNSIRNVGFFSSYASFVRYEFSICKNSFIYFFLFLLFFLGSGYFAGPGKIAPRSYFAGPGKIVPRSYFAGPGKIAILDL